MWFDILAGFKSEHQKNTLLKITVATAPLWFGLDMTYQNNWLGLNDITYLTDGTPEHTYSLGELFHEISTIPEIFMLWWMLAKFIPNNKFVKYTALFKMSAAVVTLVMSFFVNPFVINLAKMGYYYWEIAAYIFNCFVFILLPTLIRKNFLVRR